MKFPRNLWQRQARLSCVLTALAALPAAAQEYCVACTGPDAVYRCAIDGARPGVSTSLQLVCISALAKEGPHATCAVRKDAGVLDCNGALKRVALPPDGTPPTVGAPALSPGQPPAVTPSETPQGDPKTVAEMMRRAKQQSDRDWEAANAKIKSNNDKIGGFFKKSWNCLSSLFARCGEQ